MGRLSATSNPTNLKEINRSRVSISVIDLGGRRSFMLDRLDLISMGLADNLNVVVIGRAGNTNRRFDLGTVAMLDRSAQSLDGLDRSQSLRFRVLLHEAGNPQLVASIEDLCARDDAQSESLLPMEAVDLGERVWKLVIKEDEGPVLQFNVLVFPNAAGAENYVPFGALVIPEALRQVMAWIAQNPGCLEDEAGPWGAWANWMKGIGAEPLPTDPEDGEGEIWCDRVTDRFCGHFRFASQLHEVLLKESAND